MATIQSICDYFNKNYTGSTTYSFKFKPSEDDPECLDITYFDGDIDDDVLIVKCEWPGLTYTLGGEMILVSILENDEWISDEEYELYHDIDNVPEHYAIEMLLRLSIDYLEKRSNTLANYAHDMKQLRRKGFADRTNEWRMKHMTTEELAQFMVDYVNYGSNKLRKKNGWIKWLNRKSEVPLKEDMQ